MFGTQTPGKAPAQKKNVDREVVYLAERAVELDSIELAAAIFGNGDQNVRLLESEFGVTAVCRGSELKFTGSEEGVTAALHAVQGMVTLMENRTPLDEQTVRYCINLAREGEEKRLQELTNDFVAVTAKGRPIHPKTLGQKEYLAAIRSARPAPARPTLRWQWQSRLTKPRRLTALS